MKKIKTLSVGLSVLFLLSCENKQDANKPEKPKVETEKTSTDNSEKSHENHLQKQIVSLIDGIQKGKPDEVKAYFDFPIKNDNFWYSALESEEWEKHLEIAYANDKITMTFNSPVYYEDMVDEYSQVFVFITKDGILKFKDFQIAG